MRMSN